MMMIYYASYSCATICIAYVHYQNNAYYYFCHGRVKIRRFYRPQEMNEERVRPPFLAIFVACPAADAASHEAGAAYGMISKRLMLSRR